MILLGSRLAVLVLAAVALEQACAFGFGTLQSTGTQWTRRSARPTGLPSIPLSGVSARQSRALRSTTDTNEVAGSNDDETNMMLKLAADPQVFGTGYSANPGLLEAIQEATDQALSLLPPVHSSQREAQIDLAIVSISSLYDGQASPSIVVPAVLSSANVYGKGVQHLVGCTAGGIISSTPQSAYPQKDGVNRECKPIETEGLPGVSVTLALLPGVHLKTFHVMGDDVPDDVGQVDPMTWKRAVGLQGVNEDENGTDLGKDDPPSFLLLPSPAFQNELDDLMQGLQFVFPGSHTLGGIASTVSSLSRARLFRYDVSDRQCIQTLSDGCLGVALEGDIELKTMIAQGAKPVGGIYRIVSGSESTIGAIVLDEAATEQVENDETFEEEEDENLDAKAKMSAAYAKARIPKPVLAEVNFVMRTLSDDDQVFMRKAILVGIERGGSIGRTPNELARLAAGEGHRFTVHQVASAGMKDGSITLPLGSVNIESGTRIRFFVREGGFAKKEVEAIWMGYKKRSLEESFNGTPSGSFVPTACFVMSTLDRGTKLFGGKSGYESSAVSEFLPTVPSISGFFSNGIIGQLDDDETMVHGSAACYCLFGSKTKRPIYSPAKAAEALANAARQKEEDDAVERELVAENEKRTYRSSKGSASLISDESLAPRSEDGELILKRREIHSGRALTVSAVEWSVAEKTATPTSALEGFMWDKETEVDRFRERVPLSNLLSQCKLAMMDPSKHKPRDWVGPIKQAASDGTFVIIPECKRIEPVYGSLRKRYDVAKLVKQFIAGGAPSISVNCDAVMFGGSIDDVESARGAASSAAIESASHDGVVLPPILASDLLLYPYQLYKLRLAGADAVTLMVGALAGKDLLYLSKIAGGVGLQTIAVVTSEVQIRSVTQLAPGGITALVISNRELENFSFDESGEQALNLLKSDALADFRAKHGSEVPILVDGRVGIITRTNKENGNPSTLEYINELKENGAMGAIVSGGLAVADEADFAAALRKIMERP